MRDGQDPAGDFYEAWATQRAANTEAAEREAAGEPEAAKPAPAPSFASSI